MHARGMRQHVLWQRADSPVITPLDRQVRIRKPCCGVLCSGSSTSLHAAVARPLLMAPCEAYASHTQVFCRASHPAPFAPSSSPTPVDVQRS